LALCVEQAADPMTLAMLTPFSAGDALTGFVTAEEVWTQNDLRLAPGQSMWSV
jgi:hypothetical protein